MDMVRGNGMMPLSAWVAVVLETRCCWRGVVGVCAVFVVCVDVVVEGGVVVLVFEVEVEEGRELISGGHIIA